MKRKALAQIDLSDGIGSIDDVVVGYKAGQVLAAGRGFANVRPIRSRWEDHDGDERYDLVFTALSPGITGPEALLKSEDEKGQRFKGRVTTGVEEGQYYISLDSYRSQFKEKLGFEPYPGTLNLKLKKPFVQHEASAVSIVGFKDASRTFGWGKCYPKAH